MWKVSGALVGAGFLLAAMTVAPAGAAVELKEVGDEVAVGKNAVGEDCKLRLMAMALADEASTSHPVSWAPFVLVGDGGSIGPPSSPPTPLPTSGGRGASGAGR
jgi:hypothetical protein